MVFGLALVMALLFGVASTALGANGGNFILGKATNAATKVTGLVGKVAAGQALVVKNPSGGSALGLSVGDPLADPASKAVAPMKVDSQAKVENFNADQLDGKSSEDFAASTHPHSGADITTGTVAEPRIDTLVARDSEVVNRYMQGSGHARHGALSLAAGITRFFFDMPYPGLVVMYTCPTDLASNGQLSIRNNGSETVNLFSDNGSTNPNHFGQLAPNQTFHQGAAAGGEFITLQVQGSSVTTIDVFSAHRSNDCHVQAQGIATRP